MDTRFVVIVGAGSLRPADPAWTAPHAWTADGVAVVGAFTGAHLLHTAVGGCVLNDLYREAAAQGLELDGVAVTVEGGFDDAWASTGIRYRVEVDSPAARQAVQALLAQVDEVAEIPRTVRAGAPVERIA